MADSQSADHCFPPLSNSYSRLLILGSYPGVTSLEMCQYYAFPQNVFWRIMSDLICFEYDSGYEERTTALKEAGIALWDVLYSCRRTGSLDSKIQSPSIVTNNFAEFFLRHPMINTIIFNGAKAEQEFLKRVLPELSIGSMSLVRLPSTSPAMASMSYVKKREAWKVVKDFL